MAEERINLMMSMGLLEIIGTAFSIFKKNFLLYLKLGIVFIIPSAILTVFAVFKAVGFYNIINVNTDDPKAYTEFFSLATMIVLILVINAFFKSSVIDVTKRIIIGQRVSFEKTVFSSMKAFPMLLATYMIGNFMIFTGLCFFLLPGILLMVFMIYVPQIYIIESKSLYSNLRKSFVYCWKSFFTAFLVPLFIYMTYVGMLVILMSLFTSDMMMHLFFHGARPEIKLENLVTTSYKAFLITQLAVFYLSFYFFFLFNQIAITLKYLNVKTVEEGPIMDDEITDPVPSE